MASLSVAGGQSQPSVTESNMSRANHLLLPLLTLLLSSALCESAVVSSSSSGHLLLPTGAVGALAGGSGAIGCRSAPPIKTFQMLNRICEDCFQLYREADVFHMCRSDCFGSDYFVGCMDMLLLERAAKLQAAALVANMHGFVK